MSGRDANQLAADVRDAMDAGGDFFYEPVGKAGIAALDALVARVTDLEAQVANAWEHERLMMKRTTAAEEQVAALTQERNMARAGRDQWQRDAEGRGIVMYELLARAVAAEAALTNMTAWHNEANRDLRAAEAALAQADKERGQWANRYHTADTERLQAESALATTRQALSEIAEGCARWEAWDKTVEDQEHWRKAAIARVSVIGAAARRALATEEQT